MTVPATPGREWLSTSRESNMGRSGGGVYLSFRTVHFSHPVVASRFTQLTVLVKVKQKSSDSLHVRGLQIEERRLQEVPPAVLGTARREAANS
jgi:hypothetical protein